MKFRYLLILVSFFLLQGCFPEQIERDDSEYTPEAKALIEEVFAPFAGDTLVDHHVHIIGLGNSGSGIRVNADMRSVIHPFKYARFVYFLDASGITIESQADEQYVSHLLKLTQDFPVPFKVGGLALDQHYNEDGQADDEITEIYIPDEYVLGLMKQHPHRIQAVVSIHPYRQDAVEALERAAQGGARMVKWIPNAMGIDPSSPRCDAFYDAMVRLDMTLLSHGGEEQSIDSRGRQHLGSPLLLRRALDRGVRVVVAHCAASGSSVDLDDEEGGDGKNFEFFLRMMENPEYVGQLFGDVSAITLVNQIDDHIVELLSATDLHSRLLYGSDYPLPAVTILNSNMALNLLGYLDEAYVPILNEIQQKNPLLYNFMLLRVLEHPDSGQRFPESLFRQRLF